MLIYHTSDLHDHRGIAPRLRALREHEPGLLFDCGDALRGSQTVFHRNEPILADLTAAGYDVQGIGNREFHYFYGCMRARAAAMPHSLLCSNLLDTRGRALPFAREMQIERDGASLHLLAMLIMQYPVGSLWERVFGWRFLQPWDVVAEYVRRLDESDTLVVLSHLGLSLDRKLAQAHPRIDLILGGHSHDTLFEPLAVNGVPIIHAGPYGQYVSRTELCFDEQRRRHVVRNSQLVPLLGPA